MKDRVQNVYTVYYIFMYIIYYYHIFIEDYEQYKIARNHS